MGWDTTIAAAPFDIVDPTTGKNVGIIDADGIHWYDPNNNFYHAVDINAGGIEIKSPNGAGTSMQQDANGSTFTQSPPNSGAVDPIFNASMYTTIGAGPDYRPYTEWQAPAINRPGVNYSKRRMYGPGEQTATSDTVEYADSFRVVSDTDYTTEFMKSDASGLSVLGKALPKGLIACFWTRGGTICTTPSTGAETPMPAGAWNPASSAAFTLQAGRVAKLKCHVRCYDTVSENAKLVARVRRSLNSVSATSFGEFNIPFPAVSAQQVLDYDFETYVYNSSNADIPNITPGLTIARATGTGQVSLYGDGADWNCSLKITVEDMGLASQLPNLDMIGIAA